MNTNAGSRIKIVLAVIFSLILTFAMMPMTASASSEGSQSKALPKTWDGTADTSWCTDYDNTTSYIISNAEQFAGLAKLVNDGTHDFSSKTVTLDADIVLNNTSNWTSWGTNAPANQWKAIGHDDTKGFNGTFDGNGHSVSGVYVNSTASNQGLFGCSSGMIKNVGVKESYIHGRGSISGVLGYNHQGTIENCYNTGTISGESSLGGVTGWNAGTITNCYNTGMVSGEVLIGGVAGYNRGTVANSYNTGTVSGTYVTIGGIAGQQSGTVTNSYNTGTVSGNTYGHVGGIAGINFDGGGGKHVILKNCYNTGDVSANKEVGGVTGSNSDTSGGTETVENSYNIGSVTLSGGSETSIGGLAGYNDSSNAAVKKSYFLKATDKSSLVNNNWNAVGSNTNNAVKESLGFFKDNGGTLIKDETVSTPLYADNNTLIAQLNAWIGNQSGYFSWKTDQNVNEGYPFFGDAVKLVTNGGAISDGHVIGYINGIENQLPVNVTKSGYTFAGWYENAEFAGNAVTVIPSSATGDKAYYAKWTKKDTLVKPAAPTVKAKTKDRYSVKVSWKKSTGATSYKVYKATKKHGKYKMVGTVKGTSKTVKKLKANKKYWFKVRAINKAGHATSKAVYAKTKKEPVSFTVKNSKGNNVKVHWKTVNGAKGYQIANNSTASKKMKTYWTGKNSNNTYTSMHKTKGKTYKFQMRYYKMKNGKRVYSSWTKAKTIKVR